MHVIFEYTILLLALPIFWVLADETNMPKWLVLPGYIYAWWLFSDMEEPFIWPIASVLCGFFFWLFCWKFKKNVLQKRDTNRPSSTKDPEMEHRTIEDLDQDTGSGSFTAVVARLFFKKKQDDNPYDNY